MKMTIVIALVCLFGATIHAQTETNRLSSMRETYEQRKQVLLTNYANNLTALLAAATKAGNLDAVLDLRNETMRFKEEMTVLPPNDANIIWRRASILYHTDHLELQKQYQGALDQYIKQLVASDRLDEAITANDEKSNIELDMDRLRQLLPRDGQSQIPPPGLPKARFKSTTLVNDTHGFTGRRSMNNEYLYSVDAVGKKAIFRFWASGDKGTDTHGEVLLITPRGQRVIYNWSPRDFQMSAQQAQDYKRLKPIEVDVSEHISEPGQCTFAFRYKSGMFRLDILRTELELK